MLSVFKMKRRITVAFGTPPPPPFVQLQGASWISIKIFSLIAKHRPNFLDQKLSGPRSGSATATRHGHVDPPARSHREGSDHVRAGWGSTIHPQVVVVTKAFGPMGLARPWQGAQVVIGVNNHSASGLLYDGPRLYLQVGQFDRNRCYDRMGNNLAMIGWFHSLLEMGLLRELSPGPLAP